MSELQSYVTRAVYSPELWIAVRNDDTGEIVATGIAEMDRENGVIEVTGFEREEAEGDQSHVIVMVDTLVKVVLSL